MRIERVLADNAGPFTGPGTNTWILDDGSGRTLLIDPGPLDDRHLDRLVEKVRDRAVRAVLVTHTHQDHAPLANALATALGVEALGHQPGPEFEPDTMLKDGATFGVGDLELHVVHTPGHSMDHLCFRVNDVLFTGDHIMGGSSVMVERMGPYLDSLRKLRGTGLTRLYPGHGDAMDSPDAVIDWYLAHRLQRHEEILAAIQAGATTAGEIVDTVYDDVPKGLHELAQISVAAHVGLLAEEGRIALIGHEIVILPPEL
jgi:glyoxylase-like metal-dependent hydrolase (beta-lactamase superfamily II)